MTASPSASPAELIVIGGATGTGKTELSLQIAEQLRASGRAAAIINGDAMQLYRGMDVGTAKLKPDMRRGMPHHLFDVLDVDEDATVAAYQPQARGIVTQLLARDVIPILVGGSGLYLAAVMFDFEFPERDAAVRGELEQELADWGAGMLYRRLQEFDPAAAERIDPHNGRRIVRALEVIKVTGRPFSAQLPQQDHWWRRTAMVLPETARPALVERLDARVVEMWQNGIVEETEVLLARGLERGVTAQRAIGYAQAMKQLRGQLTRQEAIADAQQLTRKYARRQVSWFRRYETALRIPTGNPSAAELALEHAGLR